VWGLIKSVSVSEINLFMRDGAAATCPGVCAANCVALIGHDQCLISSAFFLSVDLMLPEVTELSMHSLFARKMGTLRNLQSKIMDSDRIVRCYSECVVI
jgi:hypothetical protein